MTAIDYPPMQDPASFNLDAVKKKIDEMIKEHERAVSKLEWFPKTCRREFPLTGRTRRCKQWTTISITRRRDRHVNGNR